MNCDQGYKLYLKVRWIKFESEDCDATVICDYKSAIDIIKSLYKLEDRVRISRISESYTFRIGVGMNQCNLKVKTNAIITRNLRIPQYPYKQSSRRWSSGIFGWFQDMESCYDMMRHVARLGYSRVQLWHYGFSTEIDSELKAR